MSEKQIEAYLRDAVKKAGGKAYKFVSPGNDGVPDRLVCLPGGRAAFAELKAPGKKSTPQQERRQAELSALGFTVRVIDSRERADRFLAELSAQETSREASNFQDRLQSHCVPV